MEDTESSLLTGVNSVAQMFAFEVKVVGCNTCNNNVCSNGYREHEIPKAKTAVYFNDEWALLHEQTVHTDPISM